MGSSHLWVFPNRGEASDRDICLSMQPGANAVLLASRLPDDFHYYKEWFESWLRRHDAAI